MKNMNPIIAPDDIECAKRTTLVIDPDFPSASTNTCDWLAVQRLLSELQ
jgi:hypothetical protein